MGTQIMHGEAKSSNQHRHWSFAVVASGVALVVSLLALGVGTAALLAARKAYRPSAASQSQTGRSASTTTKDSASNGTKNGTSENIPTLYIHGYEGGASTTNTLIANAKQYNGASKVLTATISPVGEVHLSGTWEPKIKRPLIQVLFTDNANKDYTVTTKWLHNLITTLQSRYHIRQYNIVAHSMGNVAAMHYEEQYGQDPSLPKLAKLVTIAGNFNGELGEDDAPNKNSFKADGSPQNQTQDYKAMLSRRAKFPDGVDLLNIYGNLNDGTNSDGDVSTVSARAVGYLLRGKAKSYQETGIYGAMGQHSKLHENRQVAAAIGAFLWQPTD